MFASLIQKFKKNSSGNVAAIFGLTALPVVIAMGGAIDIVRITSSSSKLQAAVESSVLSAASLTNQQPIETAVNEYIQANLANDANFDNLIVNITSHQISITKKHVEVTATADYPMSFMQLVGIDTHQISASAEAIEAIEQMEISMVLDISSSMRGNRLTNLKDAASDFVDQMLTPRSVDYTSINLVPFGGTVNLGTEFEEHVVDTSASNTETNPDEDEYDRGYDIVNKKYRFTEGDSCIELRKEDFDLETIPADSRSQMPHFWKWNNFNPWCPEATSAAVWNSNNATTLKNRINEFTLSDGTGMDHGLLWGAKALSPAYQGTMGGDFPDRPSVFNADSIEAIQKIVVLMTDGGITAQYRPEDYTRYSTHTNNKNNKNQQTLLSRGNMNHTSSTNSAIGNFKKSCEDLKSKGVIIFTIGFQIRAGSLPEQLLEYCATNPANYYLVESLDIAEAFNAIAAAVQKLRIAG